MNLNVKTGEVSTNINSPHNPLAVYHTPTYAAQSDYDASDEYVIHHIGIHMLNLGSVNMTVSMQVLSGQYGASNCHIYSIMLQLV